MYIYIYTTHSRTSKHGGNHYMYIVWCIMYIPVSAECKKLDYCTVYNYYCLTFFLPHKFFSTLEIILYCIFHYSSHFNTWMVTHPSANQCPRLLNFRDLTGTGVSNLVLLTYFWKPESNTLYWCWVCVRPGEPADGQGYGGGRGDHHRHQRGPATGGQEPGSWSYLQGILITRAGYRWPRAWGLIIYTRSTRAGWRWPGAWGLSYIHYTRYINNEGRLQVAKSLGADHIYKVY